jgi:zinc transport system ATP-binding protein
MTGHDPVVELENVTFAYNGDAPALDDVSLRVEGNDFVGVIGPNGGGKTTLLKVMLGLLEPSAGRVRVLGRSPARVRHRIGYVPQHAAMDPAAPADVMDIVLTGRLARSSWGFVFGESDRQAATRALEQVGVAELARRRIRELSGGQRQRVLIARALAADAQLLLLDEPTSGVDVHAESGLVELLHRLNDTLPIVMVSHDVAFVSRHLKRVACLNRRLVVHDAGEVTAEVIAEMYHDHVAVVEHRHDCPSADEL